MWQVSIDVVVLETDTNTEATHSVLQAAGLALFKQEVGRETHIGCGRVWVFRAARVGAKNVGTSS